MDRTEKAGLGIAVVGHVVLFGALSLGLLASKPPEMQTQPIDISLVDAVALDAQAPPAPEPPAQSRAPEQGPPEDAAPPAPSQEAEPEPAPPVPQPKAAPPPKPAPNAPPQPKKPVVAKPDSAKPTVAKSATPKTKSVADAKATGSTPGARKPRASGSILDDSFRKGLTMTASESKAPTPPGASMNAKAAADITSAIVRQVQPCADRQVNPGPGASRIVVTIRLRLAPTGALSVRPEIVGEPGGVDDENGRYVDAVKRNAIATFTGCAPLRGLPTELYDVPRGWKVFSLRYRLPG